jgi:hypothetical protein
MESPSSSMSVDIGWFVPAVTPYHPSTISNDNQYQTNVPTNTLKRYGVLYRFKAKARSDIYQKRAGCQVLLRDAAASVVR